MLLPREHGAYGQLLFPLGTALAMGHPSAAAFAVAGSAVAAFAAHEPLMVLFGRRGVRARHAQQQQARRWLITSNVAALVLGVAGVVLLPPGSRWTVLVPIATGTLAAVVFARGNERTTTGEIVVAAALASASFPVAVAGSATTVAALTCALAFAAAFTAATLSVRAVISDARRGGPQTRATALGAALLLVAADAGLAASRVILPAGLWAALPMFAIALVLAVIVPPPRYLRQIGWTLVGASALTGIILVMMA